MYEDKIKNALNNDNVIESLRNIVFEMKSNNLNKDEVYSIFYNYYLKLEEDNNYNSEYIWDVLDMISGWYVGQNIDL